MNTPQKRLAALEASAEYEKKSAAYSNAYEHGAGRQRPGTVGFALWLLYDKHLQEHNDAPTSQVARNLAREFGLNETSAVNALGKWAAYNGLRPPRTGAYSVGPTA